ncbi:MAG: FKBP-type peptidyl-prolyl cis-trans isomerase [Mariprofundaceae bacterium]|nr:FKBP-type peptidyl-prolyl cis-trans isomerase [Mariprofundaceae bacterium]
MKQMFFLWVGLLALSMPMNAGAGGDKQKQPMSHHHTVSHAGTRKAPEIMLKNSTEKLSYAFGMQVADSLKQDHTKIDVDRFILGFKDSLEGKKALLSPKKAKKFRDRFYEKKRQLLAEKNQAEARKFLTENRRKKGVITTSSGLQYLVLRKGYGSRPESSDIVRVQYSGRLMDGSEFYSTYKRERSVVLPVGGVIRGLGEAFELMTVGSRYRFFIPPKLAYGKHGSGKKIEPDVALVYEIELLAIESPRFKR